MKKQKNNHKKIEKNNYLMIFLIISLKMKNLVVFFLLCGLIVQTFSCIKYNSKEKCKTNSDCCWNPRKSYCVNGFCMLGTCLARGKFCYLDAECCSKKCIENPLIPNYCY